MTIGQLLSASAARNPQQVAIASQQESISYQHFDQSVTLLAQWLVRQGYRKGERVALFWPNSTELVKLFCACFRAGLVAVTVNVRLKTNEVAHVLTHSQAVICFAHPDLASVAEEASRGRTMVRMHTIPTIDGEARGIALPKVRDEDPALILYTSGKTARPKGVTHSHRSLLENIEQICKTTPNSLQTILVMTQMAFISAMAAGMLLAVSNGGTLVLIRAFDAAVALDMIERFRCTFTFGLPVMVQLLIEEQTRRPRDVSSLRTFIAGGDSVPMSMQQGFQALFGIPVREGFGMTEIGAAITNPADFVRPGSLGKPLDGVQARVIGANGKDVQQGATGSCCCVAPRCLRGTGTMRRQRRQH
jgi:long-chain acyl-CoA synthetase